MTHVAAVFASGLIKATELIEVQELELARLRSQLAMAREMERMWYDRYYTLWISADRYGIFIPAVREVYARWAEQVNEYYKDKGEPRE